MLFESLESRNTILTTEIKVIDQITPGSNNDHIDKKVAADCYDSRSTGFLSEIKGNTITQSVEEDNVNTGDSISLDMFNTALPYSIRCSEVDVIR